MHANAFYLAIHGWLLKSGKWYYPEHPEWGGFTQAEAMYQQVKVLE